MKFVKMHGIGNDYVYVDAVREPGIESRPDLPALARAMSDRHTGVGSDGLILVCRPSSDGAATGAAGPRVRMRMFNADGSESEMCGNGLRCVAKFAHDRLGIRNNPMLIQTGRGTLSVAYRTDSGALTVATVDMGEPILEARDIPVDLSRLAPGKGGREFESIIEAGGGRFGAVFVSMGNPHAVIFVDKASLLPGPDDLARLGRLIEHHDAFPRRVNVHFAAPHGRAEATMRTWERGAGATLACGTGACAVLVAGVLTGRLDRKANLHLPGGDLEIEWDKAINHVFMTGPAADVFEGTWPA